MNKGMIFAVGGFALGFVVGLFAGKAKYQKFYEDRSNEEIEEMREHYKEKLEDLAGDIIGDRPVEASRAPVKPSLESLRKRYISEDEEPVPEPSEDVGGYDEDDDPPFEEDIDGYTKEELDDIGDTMAEERERQEGLDPKLITAEEFGEISSFDQDSLIYYQEDNTLTTDDDLVIEDRESYVGNCLTKFGFEDSDEQKVYVRNYRKETDYEVIKIFSAFKY